jgi:hypothetical protein
MCQRLPRHRSYQGLSSPTFYQWRCIHIHKTSKTCAGSFCPFFGTLASENTQHLIVPLSIDNFGCKMFPEMTSRPHYPCCLQSTLHFQEHQLCIFSAVTFSPLAFLHLVSNISKKMQCRIPMVIGHPCRIQ